MKLNSKVIFQVGLLGVLAVAIWQFGFKLATLDSYPHHEMSGEVSESEKEKSTYPIKPSLSTKPNRSESSLSRNLADSTLQHSSQTIQSQSHHLIEKHGLDQKRALLAKAFHDSEIGSKLVDVATLFQFQIRSGTEELAYLNEQIRFLEGRPEEAFEEVKYGLTQLGPEFNRERRFLLDWVSRLPGNESSKAEFFSNEIKRAAKDLDSTHQSYFNGITALNAMYQVTKDPGRVESALREALKSPVEPNAQFFLISAYGEKEPERALKLKEDLSK